jgi:glutathione reductase (NADPH)
VAIAEYDLVGGTCVIRGCVPKKLMVYASQFSYMYEYAQGYGWGEVDPKFDWNKLITAVDTEVKRLSQLHPILQFPVDIYDNHYRSICVDEYQRFEY